MPVFRKTCGGYVGIANGRRTELFHRVFVESVIHRTLPPGAEIHHVDGNKQNNSRENLVVCPSKSYHRLLHQRMRSLAACGNANWLKCRFCAKYDDPANLVIWKRKVTVGKRSGSDIYHRDCKRADVNRQAAKRRERKAQ